MKWTEKSIAAFLARFTFAHKHLLLLPNCSWPGSECDLLGVTPNLRIIDIEIKISRSDLRADAKKDKWFHNWDWKIDGPWGTQSPESRRKREWPAKVWKHYYVMPKEIWTPELLRDIQPISGVLLLGDRHITCERAAKPCRDAEKISAEDAIDIARLASLRMWDAYDTLNYKFTQARGDADWQFRDIRAKAATDSPSLKDAQLLLGHGDEATTTIYRRSKGAAVAPLKRFSTD